MATIMPITTNTTMAICIQIQVGDMAETAYRHPHGRAGAAVERERRRGRLLADVRRPAQRRFRASMLPTWLDASGGRQDALAERSRCSPLL
jgi:hypothetical protein